MDFSNVNMPDILKNGMKNKFQDFPHFDFEDFIGQLFKNNGYEVVETPRTGDYGADLILTKSEEKIAVQIKRYAQDNKVGVQEMNQVIGAKDFYKCGRAMIITTSSFSNSGKKLASETSTELWDWDKLQKYICDTYLEGKDYYAYFGDSLKTEEGEKSFEFEITDLKYQTPMQKIGPATLVSAKMINITNRNIYVLLGIPTFISVKNQQVEACFWFEGYFNNGVVYAGSSVQLAFMFRPEQVPSVKEGDRFIFKWVEDEKEFHSYDLRVTPETVQKGLCYVVTMCYGAHSPEYEEMIFFRDNILGRYKIGNSIIKVYYRVGGHLAEYLKRNEVAKTISRFILKIILIPVKRWNRRSRNIFR